MVLVVYGSIIQKKMMHRYVNASIYMHNHVILKAMQETYVSVCDTYADEVAHNMDLQDPMASQNQPMRPSHQNSRSVMDSKVSGDLTLTHFLSIHTHTDITELHDSVPTVAELCFL